MNNVISQMLSKYEIKNTHDEVNALKEVIQEIVLSGLARGNFLRMPLFMVVQLLEYFII